MTDVSRQLRIAVAAEYRKLAADIEKGEKAAFLAENEPGTKLPIRDREDGNALVGSVLITEASTPEPKPVVEDESALIPWLIERFGEHMVEEVPATIRVTPQGINSAEASALAGDDVPGVGWSDPKPGVPQVKWVPRPGAAQRLVAMAARGEFSVADVLALPGGEPA